MSFLAKIQIKADDDLSQISEPELAPDPSSAPGLSGGMDLPAVATKFILEYGDFDSTKRKLATIRKKLVTEAQAAIAEARKEAIEMSVEDFKKKYGMDQSLDDFVTLVSKITVDDILEEVWNNFSSTSDK